MEKIFTCVELDPVPAALPEQAIWARLGRNRYLSEISPECRSACRTEMLKAFELCQPRGRWCLLKVENVEMESVRIADFGCLRSAEFAAFTASAPYLWLGAVTVGEAISQAAAALQSEKMSSAVIYDAVGSECADAAIGLLQQHAAVQLARSGMQLDKRRFSPGYGKLSLSVQQEIFAKLRLEQYGMTLNESFIMQPEKSVTAFARVF